MLNAIKTTTAKSVSPAHQRRLLTSAYRECLHELSPRNKTPTGMRYTQVFNIPVDSIC